MALVFLSEELERVQLPSQVELEAVGSQPQPQCTPGAELELGRAPGKIIALDVRNPRCETESRREIAQRTNRMITSHVTLKNR